MRDNFAQPKVHPRQEHFGKALPFQQQYDRDDPLDNPYDKGYSDRNDPYKRNSDFGKQDKDPMVWDAPEDLPFDRKSAILTSLFENTSGE